jgi:hypothetical protein
MLAIGALTVEPGATLTGTDSFMATGLVTLSDGSSVSGRFTIDAEGGLTLSSAGSFLHLTGVALDNHGTASWTGGPGIFAANGAAINNLPGATFNAQANAELVWDTSLPGPAPAFNNAGAFVRSGGTGATDIQIAFNNSGAVSTQAGTLDLGSGVGGGTTNSGQIVVSPGATIYSGLYTQTGGTTSVNGGILVNGPFVINGGALTGSGNINGNVTNGAQVIPGGAGSTGQLTINGNYTQTAAAALDVELGGTAPAAIDEVAVSGTASLAGQLDVAMIGNFLPALGNTFPIMTFGTRSGNFATTNGLSLASGLFLDSVFSGTSLTLDTNQVAISGAPAFALAGVPINLTAVVTGPSAGNAFTFSWTVTQNGNPFASGAGSNPSFTPSSNGTYVVTLTAAGAAGGQGTTSVQLVVAPSILVLNPTASGSLTLSGNASMNIPGAIVVDSSSSTALAASGNAHVTASVIDVAGEAHASGNASLQPSPTTGFAPVLDPLAGLLSPSATGVTNFGSVSVSGHSQSVLSPGLYSQIAVSGSASLTLNPGTYIIEGGGFTVTGNASATGSGVMIYNAGSNYPNSGGNFGGITLSGNGTFNLSAPTSGAYTGILIFQSRQNTRALSFSGNATAGMAGTIYAANAALSMSGNAQLQSSLDVGTLNLTGNVSLTQTAAGSGGVDDAQGLANTLLAGNLSVDINDPNGYFTPDDLARIQDAISAWDALLAPYSVAITEVTDPALANVVIDTDTTSACGGAGDGVLGCYDSAKSEITLVQGWNWYAGSDPTQIAAGQYDFETTVTHELGHALGLGHSGDPSSPMYATLSAGAADRSVTAQDLNIPDPPAGADPQLAANFHFMRALASYSQSEVISALGSGPIAIAGGQPPSFPAAATATSFMGQSNLYQQPEGAMPGQPFVTQLDTSPSLGSPSRDRQSEHRPLPWLTPESPVRMPALDSSEQRDTPTTQQPIRADNDYEHLAPQVRPDAVLDGGLDDLAGEAILRYRQVAVTPVHVSVCHMVGPARSPVSVNLMRPTDGRQVSGDFTARMAVILLASGLSGYGTGIVGTRARRAGGLRPRS